MHVFVYAYDLIWLHHSIIPTTQPDTVLVKWNWHGEQYRFNLDINSECPSKGDVLVQPQVTWADAEITG